MFTRLLARFPDYTIVEKPTSEQLTRYRDHIPAEMIEIWEQYGFGVFCDGYLKVVNPDDYADLLAETYQLSSTPSSAPPIVLFATGMGDLLVWEIGYLALIDYRHGETSIVAKNFTLLFRNLADGGETLAEKFAWLPYPAACKQLGEPAYDECFGYVPLIALGGPETVEHLQKVKLREHIALIAEFTGILER
jgi:hypothetical protein